MRFPRHISFIFIVTAFLVLLAFHWGLAFVGPTGGAGGTGGAIQHDSGKLSIGASAPVPDTKLLILAPSSASNSFALKVVQPAATSVSGGDGIIPGTPLFLVRNDGRVVIGGSIGSSTGTITIGGATKVNGALAATTLGGSFLGTVNARSISSGFFGQNTGGGNYSFPLGLSIGTSTAPSGIALFNGNIGFSSGPAILSSGSLLQLQAGGAATTTGSIYFLDSARATRGRFDTTAATGTSSYGTFYTGLTNTSGADLAEYYVSGDRSLEPGDVVAISNATLINGKEQIVSKGVLRKTKNPYDTQVVGVISTAPGLVTGSIDGETNTPDNRLLTLAGRTPVKVSNENGPINIGDRLTPSSIQGVAMKATRPGETIGIALETWSGGGGVVMALVRSGYLIPKPNTYGLEAARKEIRLSGSSRVVNGEARVFFDQSFSSLISHEEQIKVFIMSTENVLGELYVAEKTPYGFIVRESEGASGGTFDWLVIARAKG